MTTDRPQLPSLKSLIVGPAVITLAVTLLRLIGELQEWSPRFFSRQGGGGGALVGIVWLIPIFGVYFAWKLARAGAAPAAGRAIGHAVIAVALVAVTMVVASQVLKLGQNGLLGAFTLAGLAAAFIAYRGWPALGRTLLAYGLAARIPVILVMLAAFLGHWGTHYDAPPPGFPAMAPLPKWFFLGVLPQTFLWIPFTIFLGAFFGALSLLAVGRRREAPVAPAPGMA